MGYDCDECFWKSGTDNPDQSMPRYEFGTNDNGDRVQVAHCPNCQKILDIRKNTI